MTSPPQPLPGQDADKGPPRPPAPPPPPDTGREPPGPGMPPAPRGEGPEDAEGMAGEGAGSNDRRAGPGGMLGEG